MYGKIVMTLFLCALSCSVFAYPINGYFRQGITIHNRSSEAILITDDTLAEIKNYSILPQYELEYTYNSDQFTNSQGQSFGHAIQINEVNGQPICTITTKLTLTLNSNKQEKADNSNPDRCRTSSIYSSSIKEGIIFGSDIIVN